MIEGATVTGIKLKDVDVAGRLLTCAWDVTTGQLTLGGVVAWDDVLVLMGRLRAVELQQSTGNGVAPREHVAPVVVTPVPVPVPVEKPAAVKPPAGNLHVSVVQAGEAQAGFRVADMRPFMKLESVKEVVNKLREQGAETTVDVCNAVHYLRETEACNFLEHLPLAALDEQVSLYCSTLGMIPF